MIFEHGKLDPHVGDVDVLAGFPLVLEEQEWHALASSAEALAREVLEAERELIERPDLHRALGLPYAIRHILRTCGHTRNAVRFMRFDFHPTDEGWRISEVNADVPGGFLESAPLASLMAEHYPGLSLTGDPGRSLAHAICRAGDIGHVGLVHETEYTEDGQMMAYLGRLIRELGAEAHLIGPSQVEWSSSTATMRTDWRHGPLDAIIRYYPGEWLASLSRLTDWQKYFGSTPTVLANPATALLTQTKRFPLVWDQLETPLPTWRMLLPETREPCKAARAADWVLKPAMGRVGYGIAMPGVTSERDSRSAWRWAMLRPRNWVAQCQFKATPVTVEGADWFPCVGVYVIDGRTAGAYGRVARRALITAEASEVAVLVRSGPNGFEKRRLS
jgi:glutathionylspermidine synthase